MTREEFLSWAKSSGAVALPKAADLEILQTKSGLQQMKAAIIPPVLEDFYKTGAGGMFLCDAYIFGITEEIRVSQNTYHIPSLLQVNREISNLAQMRGKTAFGRNSLFWFAFDAFGNFFMLSNTALAPVRQYGDIYKAMVDCLAVGKI
jgi:hypothetical protein